MEIDMFLGPLIGNSPALVFWIAVIIFAIIMLRRGGGRAERFLMTGAIIKIIGNLLNIPTTFIPIWLMHDGYSMDSAVAIASNCGIFINVIGMAGIICLIYAFWVKFKAINIKSTGSLTIPTLERGSYDTSPEY